MLNNDYIPERGDIIWLNFNPQTGKEQMGRRPALVISPHKYNAKVGLVLVCPITSQVKNYPFEVKLNENLKTKGVVISDQVKSLDYIKREAEFIEKFGIKETREVIMKLQLLIS